MTKADANKSELTEPEALTLKEMVTYQAGAVVSRTIIKRKSCSMTLFAFDAGESLSEHSTPFDALLNLVEGEADITVSGEHYILKEGDIILLPASRSHAVKAVTRFKMLLTMLR